jgi:cation diffusion facilitator CzcD-associated flavoprotein CzcO
MWTVVYRNSKTAETSEQQSKFLISKIGQLVEPSYWGVKGLDSFKGVVLHCNRWNTETTLEDKDVVVIGNGRKSPKVHSKKTR